MIASPVPRSGIIILGLLCTLIGLGVAFGVYRSTNSDITPTPSPSPTPSPAIPASNEDAKAYIARASVLAEAGKYPEAMAVLDEAITKYPADQNLALTKEYYARLSSQNE